MNPGTDLSNLTFAAESIRHFQAGTKTQTRRLIGKGLPVTIARVLFLGTPGKGSGRMWGGFDGYHSQPAMTLHAPYETGQWVYFREPIAREYNPLLAQGAARTLYAADWKLALQVSSDRTQPGEPAPWNFKASQMPGMYMPRRLARYVGRIRQVRAERLSDLSEEDARAEGGPPEASHYSPDAPPTYTGGYINYWDRLNAARGFPVLPSATIGRAVTLWVWVYEIDPVLHDPWIAQGQAPVKEAV